MIESLVSAGITLPMEAISLVPHRPPMLFVDYLLKRYEDKAEARAVMVAEGICFDSVQPFPEFFIEVVAQTMAMANGYDALCAGKKMNDGMIVGVDSFSFCNTPVPGTLLHIIIEKTFEFGPVRIIHGEVFDGDLLLAEGDIKVWEDIG